MDSESTAASPAKEASVAVSQESQTASKPTQPHRSATQPSVLNGGSREAAQPPLAADSAVSSRRRAPRVPPVTSPSTSLSHPSSAAQSTAKTAVSKVVSLPASLTGSPASSVYASPTAATSPSSLGPTSPASHGPAVAASTAPPAQSGAEGLPESSAVAFPTRSEEGEEASSVGGLTNSSLSPSRAFPSSPVTAQAPTRVGGADGAWMSAGQVASQLDIDLVHPRESLLSKSRRGASFTYGAAANSSLRSVDFSTGLGQVMQVAAPGVDLTAAPVDWTRLQAVSAAAKLAVPAGHLIDTTSVSRQLASYGSTAAQVPPPPTASKSGSFDSFVDAEASIAFLSSAILNPLSASVSNLAHAATPSNPNRLAVATDRRNADFHMLFRSVPDNDPLIDDYTCALQRDIMIHGRLYVTRHHICFNSNIFGWVTNLVIAMSDILAIERRMTAYVIPNAVHITTLHAKAYASMIRLWHSVLGYPVDGLPFPSEDKGDDGLDLNGDFVVDESTLDGQMQHIDNIFADDELLSEYAKQIPARESSSSDLQTGRHIRRVRKPVARSRSASRVRPGSPSQTKVGSLSDVEQLSSRRFYPSEDIPPDSDRSQKMEGDSLKINKHTQADFEEDNTADADDDSSDPFDGTEPAPILPPILGRVSVSKEISKYGEVKVSSDRRRLITVGGKEGSQSVTASDPRQPPLALNEPVAFQSLSKPSFASKNAMSRTTFSEKMRPIVRSITAPLTAAFEDRVDKVTPQPDSSASVTNIKKTEKSEDLWSSLNQPKLVRSPKAPVYCNCNDHARISVMDRVFPASLDVLAFLLFGETVHPRSRREERSSFLFLFLRDVKKFSDITIGDWSLDTGAPTNLQVGMVRETKCVVPLKHPLGPRSTKCIGRQRVTAAEVDSKLCVREVNQTPDVPTGSTFQTVLSICLMRGSGNETGDTTRLLVACDVEFMKSSWLRGPIERSSIDGTMSYWRDLEPALMEACRQSIKKSLSAETVILTSGSTELAFQKSMKMEPLLRVEHRPTEWYWQLLDYLNANGSFWRVFDRLNNLTLWVALVWLLALLNVWQWRQYAQMEQRLDDLAKGPAWVPKTVTDELKSSLAGASLADWGPVPEWWALGMDPTANPEGDEPEEEQLKRFFEKISRTDPQDTARDESDPTQRMLNWLWRQVQSMEDRQEELNVDLQHLFHQLKLKENHLTRPQRIHHP